MGQPYPIRFPEDIEAYIEEEIQKGAIKSEIVHKLLREGFRSEKGETKKETEKQSLPTGVIVECPLRRTNIPICAWCDKCLNVVYAKTPVDSSVCKTCPKYPCETWENILTDKRLSDQKLIRKTPMLERLEQKHSLT